ncbi:MAG: tyrosine-type recombinase/integrase [Nigerium sp.]|nr:tyrosine-type recombinase/integrase [Nigerium sp.]
MAEGRRPWGKVRQLSSGRYQASYLHGGIHGVQEGTRYVALQTFDTKGDAWGWLDRERRLIDRGDWTPPVDRFRAAAEERQRKEAVRQAAAAVPTIAAYGSQYLERGELAATSRDRYRQLLKFYILAEPATITRRGMVKGRPVAKRGLGDVRVTELTRADVRLWWQGLPVGTRESSCRQAYDLLRAIMNAAVEAELIEVNPVQVKAATQAQASRERDLDPLPIEVLYAVAEQMPEPWRLGVLLGGVLGLRSGEVRALQRRDFSLNGDIPTIKVHQSVKEAEGKVEIGPLKTARKGIASRTLPIPAALVEDVKTQLREHTQLGRTALLFWRTRDGGPVKSSDWLRAFKKACKDVADQMEEDAAVHLAQTGEPEGDASQRIRELLTGRGGYVFHGTRVTGLTWAYRLSGGNLRAVQAIAGHTSPKMALRYQRAEMDYLTTVAGNVSAMIEASTRQP